MSKSDWEMAGGGPSKEPLKAAEEVRDALCRSGPLWPDLLRVARRLIEEARGGQARRIETLHGGV